MPVDLDALAAQSGALGVSAGAPPAALSAIDTLAQQSGALGVSDAAPAAAAPDPAAVLKAEGLRSHAQLRSVALHQMAHREDVPLYNSSPYPLTNPGAAGPVMVDPNQDQGFFGGPTTGPHAMANGAARIANAKEGKDVAGGASQIIRGFGAATAPLVLPLAAVAAPIPTAVGLLAGSGAQKGTEYLLDKAGAAPEYRDLGGDIAGFVAGGAAAHGAGVLSDAVGLPAKLGKVGDAVGDFAADVGGAAALGGSDLAAAVGDVRNATADALNASAKKNIERALHPGSKINKALAQDQVAEGMRDRGVTGWSLQHLAEKAQIKAHNLGMQIDDAFEAHAEAGTKLDPAPILEALQHERDAYVVDGVRIDPSYDGILGDLQDQLKQVSKNNGGEIPVGSLRTIRQILDKKIARSKGGFALAPDDASRIDALKTYTDAIRGSIAAADPALAKLNQEYSFWRNTEKVASDSALRKTGQRAPLTQRFGEMTGAAIGGGIAGALHPGLIAGGEMAGRAVGGGIGRLSTSTIWNTLSAKAKSGIADLLATGDEAGAARMAADPANHEITPAATTEPLASEAPAEAQSAGGDESGSQRSTAAPVPSGGSAIVSANGGRGEAQGAGSAEAPAGVGGAQSDAFPGSRLVGKSAVVALPDGSGVRVRYEIRDGKSVNATHSPITFAPNAKSRVRATQPRDYEDPINHGIVVERATPAGYNENYSLSSDAPSAGDGPPIAYDQLDEAGKPNGRADALAGNERHMVNLRMQEMYPEVFGRKYGAGLRERLGAYGMDPNADLSAIQNPHVFRVVEGRLSPDELQRVMTDTNKSVQKSATATEQMISDSRRVSGQTLNDLAAKVEAFAPDATLSQALEGTAGAEVVQRLIDDGVIARAEQGKYIDSEGKITKEGKLRVSGLAIGRFFTDPEQLREVQTSVRGKLERMAAPLVKIENDPDWSLTPRVSAAIDLLHRARMRGLNDLREFVKQDGLFGSEKYSPDVIHMAELLRAKGNSQQLTAGARLYAEDASFAGGGSALFGDTPTPERSFAEHFGKPGAAVESPQPVKSSKPAGGVAVADKPAAAPAPAAAKPSVVDLGGMGQAISANLYDALFAKLQKGSLTEAGAPSQLLHAAKPAFDAGEIKSPEDLARWVQDGKYEQAKAAQKKSLADLGSSRAAAPAPAPDVLYHGTSAPEFTKFASKTGDAYLTADPREAHLYATDEISGGGRLKGTPRILTVHAKPGRTLDIDDLVQDEIAEGDGDIDRVIEEASAKAKRDGYRYVTFLHPSSVSGDAPDFPVTVSLFPGEDLAIKSSAAVKKSLADLGK